MLSELPEAEVNAIVRRSGLKAITSNTITTAAQLKAELKTISSRGIRDRRRGEKKKGCGAFGAPVRAHSRKLSAAMSISGPAFRMTKERVPEVAEALMQAASELSAELGYQGLPTEALRRVAS